MILQSFENSWPYNHLRMVAENAGSLNCDFRCSKARTILLFLKGLCREINICLKVLKINNFFSVLMLMIFGPLSSCFHENTY
jgi:hypothetical protein